MDALIRKKRTLVCVGPGGVGKTTTSAAIGLRAALHGRKTLVLTVDPAHRLANSLGLDRFEHEVQEIPTAAFSAAGLSPGAPLFAQMLDTRRTFDGIVQRYSRDAATRDRILNSAFYEQASTRLSGSQEYMAMERLYELHSEGEYDLIVLDTPPTVHALDFLDAPDRLEAFMSQSTDGLVAKSTRTLGRLGLGFLKANAVILKGVGKFLGTDVFIEILEFLQDFQSMYAGFRQRAADVKRLMRHEDTAFVILSGPNRASVEEGLYFRRRLGQEGMPFGAFVVNRIRTALGPVPVVSDALAEALAAELTDAEAFIEQLLRHDAQLRPLAARDEREIARLQEALDAGDPVLAIPDFEEDIHDLGGLYRYGKGLN